MRRSAERAARGASWQLSTDDLTVSLDPSSTAEATTLTESLLRASQAAVGQGRQGYALLLDEAHSTFDAACAKRSESPLSMLVAAVNALQATGAPIALVLCGLPALRIGEVDGCPVHPAGSRALQKMPPTSPDDDRDWPSHMTALAQRIRAVQDARGISQLALAGSSGVDRHTVGNILRAQGFERSAGNPTLKSIHRLARALGVSPALLLPSADEVPLAAPREASPDFAWSAFELSLARALHRPDP